MLTCVQVGVGQQPSCICPQPAPLLMLSWILTPYDTPTHPLTPTCRDKLRGLPLAPGCVSVYIRHGDKHTEHKTYNDTEYEAALQELLALDPSLTRQVSQDSPGQRRVGQPTLSVCPVQVIGPHALAVEAARSESPGLVHHAPRALPHTKPTMQRAVCKP